MIEMALSRKMIQSVRLERKMRENENFHISIRYTEENLLTYLDEFVKKRASYNVGSVSVETVNLS